MWYNRLKGGDSMDNEKVYILSKSETKTWYEHCKKSVKYDKRFYFYKNQYNIDDHFFSLGFYNNFQVCV